MAYDFPASPTQGQQFTPVAGGPTYSWNGYAWDMASPAVVPGTLVELQRKVVTTPVTNVVLTGIDATYDEYEIHYYNVKHDTSGQALCFRASADGGATFKNSAFYSDSNYYLPPSGANAVAAGAVNQTYGQIGFAVFAPAGTPSIGEIKFARPWDAANYKYIMWNGVQPGTSEHYYFDGWGSYLGDTNAINAIQFFPFTGNFSAGSTFVLYGRSKTPLLNMTPLLPPGSRILIQSQTVGAAVAQVDFTTGIDATYDEYEIHFFGVRLASEVNLGFRISQDGGATWKAGASDYSWSMVQLGSAGSVANSQGAGTASAAITAGIQTTSTSGAGEGVVRFSRPTVAEQHILRWDTTSQATSTSFTRATGSGGFGSTPFAALSGIRFLAYPSGGSNITQGTFNLYGIKK